MRWRDCECGLQHLAEKESCPIRHLIAQTGRQGLDAIPLGFRDDVLLSAAFFSRVPPLSAGE
jgi:hypothetical protein